MTIKFYCFGESGNAYKAALPLHLSGLDYEMVEVDFFGGETRSPEYRANVNVMGEAPVMTDGDLHLTQSGVIQQYISDKTGKFNGANDAERYEVLRWVLFDNHKLSSLAGPTRFMSNFLPEDKRPQAIIDFNKGRLTASYDILNKALEGKDWLAGDGPTLAEAVAMPIYVRLHGLQRLGFTGSLTPHTESHFERCRTLDGWSAVTWTW